MYMNSNYTTYVQYDLVVNVMHYNIVIVVLNVYGLNDDRYIPWVLDHENHSHSLIYISYNISGKAKY